MQQKITMKYSYNSVFYFNLNLERKNQIRFLTEIGEQGRGTGGGEGAQGVGGVGDGGGQKTHTQWCGCPSTLHHLLHSPPPSPPFLGLED